MKEETTQTVPMQEIPLTDDQYQTLDRSYQDAMRLQELAQVSGTAVGDLIRVLGGPDAQLMKDDTGRLKIMVTGLPESS